MTEKPKRSPKLIPMKTLAKRLRYSLATIRRLRRMRIIGPSDEIDGVAMFDVRLCKQDIRAAARSGYRRCVMPWLNHRPKKRRTLVRSTTTTCDRCRAVVEAEASQLDAPCGPLRGRLDARPVDLCPGCSERFLAWLRGLPEEFSVDGRSEMSATP